MTTLTGAERRSHLRESLLLALLLHIAVLFALLSRAEFPSLPVPQTVIPVEVVPQAAFTPSPSAVEETDEVEANPPSPPAAPDAIEKPADRQPEKEAAPTPETAPPTSPARSSAQSPTLKVAKTLRAAATLSDPRNARTRAKLKSVYPSDRVIQVCNLELIEQFRAGHPDRHPDFIVAYATRDVIERGLTITAKGAALHSDGEWLNSQYKCSATADMEGISTFAYAVTDAIPKDAWAELYLPEKIDPEGE